MWIFFSDLKINNKNKYANKLIIYHQYSESKQKERQIKYNYAI